MSSLAKLATGGTLTRRGLLGLVGTALLLPGRANAQVVSGSVQTSFDHARPGEGNFALRYEWGRPRRPGHPIVLVVADGQQFYTRPGAAARLQTELFGPDVDVLVPFGRGREPALRARLGSGPQLDWALAYRLLNSEQWRADLLLLIEQLALDRAPLHLYGRSGGAYLSYELMQAVPRFANRIYVQAAVNPELDVRWGIGGDRIWSDLVQHDRALAGALLADVGADSKRRAQLVRLLQRQNFFEPLHALSGARAKLGRAFLARDEATLAALRRTYQIDALDALEGTIEGIASTVRLFEFASPREDPRTRTDKLVPDVELLFDRADPLIRLARAGWIASPRHDWSKLALQQAEVLQFAARHDHTADYRTQIGLEGAVPNGRLLLFDDDHNFKRLAATGRHAASIRAFFAHGSNSAQFEREVAAVRELLWREETA